MISHVIDNSDTNLLRKFVDFCIPIMRVKHQKYSMQNDRQLASILFGYKGENSKNLWLNNSKSRRSLEHSKFLNFCSRFETNTGILEKNNQLAKEYKEWKSRLEKIYSDKIQKEENLKKAAQFKINKIKKAINKKNISVHPFIKSLQGSKWYTYEQEGGKISRKTIEFTTLTQDGYCGFDYKTNRSESCWTGDMRFIEADSFLVGICRSIDRPEESHYTHFTIQIHERSAALKLCIGHKTFFSQRTKNVVTKTVILERFLEADENFIPYNFEFSNQVIDVKYGFVDEKIKAFLEDKHINRLTSPHSESIYDHDTFRKWFERGSKKNKTKIHESIIGTYQLIYFLDLDVTKVVTDYLIISEKMNGELHAIYREKKLDNCRHWEGKINENSSTSTLTVMLEGPVNEDGQKNNSTQIFLLLYVSSTDTGINTLTGLIAGVRAGNKGPVARMILITKYEKEKNFQAFNIETVMKFFKMFNHSIRVRPPHDRIISKFSTIIKLVKDAEK